MNVIEIIKIGLEEKGYDGLYFPSVCACLIDDLAPCGEISHLCCAGYKHSHSTSNDMWIISENKYGIGDCEIESILDGFSPEVLTKEG